MTCCCHKHGGTSTEDGKINISLFDENVTIEMYAKNRLHESLAVFRDTPQYSKTKIRFGENLFTFNSISFKNLIHRSNLPATTEG